MKFYAIYIPSSGIDLSYDDICIWWNLELFFTYLLCNFLLLFLFALFLWYNVMRLSSGTLFLLLFALFLSYNVVKL